MLTILHILSSDDKYGSAQCFLELLSYELQDHEIIPIVVTPKLNDINKKCDALGVQNYSINYEQVQIPKHDITAIFVAKYLYHSFLYYRYRSGAIQGISKIILNNDVDVIHTNSCVIDVGALAAEKTGRVNVWHLREFGKEDFHFYSVNPFIISTMNKECNRFLAISNAVKKTWLRKGITSIETIYDGVDAKRFASSASIKDHNKLQAVMSGSFCEAKNQKLLVEAINMLPTDQRKSIHIDFYGLCEGYYYQSVKELIEKYNLECIFTFRGFVTNIPEILSNYDFGILCSRAEAFGRVTVEYMMAGLCPIAPATGANLELIDENSGVLYAELTPLELSKTIANIIQGKINPKHLGNNAKVRSRNNFDIGINAIKIIDYFKKVVL
ncbi:predicted glycosyltransferase [Clostridium sp. SY8519]|uniref:glycosyltransferase family 4 protein n=1 Tax=Clostridium sp. (strain SY8519) TaxID=1042156 RepID=UPI00021722CF|nr:glycosyltransferase family 4 protein [Clostridium sp. SY8519]BAK48509.1 predicted glycosyltransferase [Clostridium sp. SY8519]